MLIPPCRESYNFVCMGKIYYCFIFVFLLCSVSVSGQTYSWSSGLGTTNADEVLASATDASGNTYIASYYSGSGMAVPAPLTPNPALWTNAADIFIAKYNATGTMQWYKRIAGTGVDYPYSMVVNSAGDVYFAGVFDGILTSGITKLSGNGGASDMFLIKYNTAGTLQWMRGVGSTSADEALAVQLDPSENPIIGGHISGLADIYTQGNRTMTAPVLVTLATTTYIGSTDIAIIEFTPAGALTSHQVYGSSGGAERLSAMKIDASGNTYIAGRFSNTVDFDPSGGVSNVVESAPLGSGDCFVAKYNSSDALDWVGSYQGGLVESIKSIGVDGAGSVYLSGDFAGFVNFDLKGGSNTLTAAGATDIFMAKYASDGTFTHVKQIGAVAAQTLPVGYMYFHRENII